MARAPRGGSWKAEYAQRVERFQRRHPGASRSAARGHPRGGEREADRLLRRLRRGLPAGSDVHFTGTDRQPDGTWRGARFDVFAGDGSFEDTFEVPEDGLGRLVEIRDAIATTGIPVLGAAYFEKMLDWLDAGPPPLPFYAIERRGRFVSGVGPKGNAKTVGSPSPTGGAFGSTDRRRVARFLSKYPQLRRRGYRIVAF